MHGAVLETVIIFEEAGSISKVGIKGKQTPFKSLLSSHLNSAEISTIVNHFFWEQVIFKKGVRKEEKVEKHG